MRTGCFQDEEFQLVEYLRLEQREQLGLQVQRERPVLNPPVPA
jgi:hypothetical protein